MCSRGLKLSGIFFVEISFEDCFNDYHKQVACMLLIPVWQYTCFNIEYDEWIRDIPSLVSNYKSLRYDEL